MNGWARDPRNATTHNPSLSVGRHVARKISEINMVVGGHNKNDPKFWNRLLPVFQSCFYFNFILKRNKTSHVRSFTVLADVSVRFFKQFSQLQNSLEGPSTIPQEEFPTQTTPSLCSACCLIITKTNTYGTKLIYSKLRNSPSRKSPNYSTHPAMPPPHPHLQ